MIGSFKSEVLPAMRFCECRHRLGIHWHGEGRCGYYEDERATLKFSGGKPITVKVGQCPCIKFTPANSSPAS